MCQSHSRLELHPKWVQHAARQLQGRISAALGGDGWTGEGRIVGIFGVVMVVLMETICIWKKGSEQEKIPFAICIPPLSRSIPYLLVSRLYPDLNGLLV